MTSFLIVGCARNVAKVLEKEINTLERCFGAFGEVTFFVVESDSTDETGELMQSIAQKRGIFRFKSLGSITTQLPDRHERMAFCRNVYVDEINSNPNYTDIDYVVVADLDGVNKDLTEDAVASCFTRDDWDGCFANQGANYYDVFALRHETWCPQDPWQEMWQLRDKGVGDLRSKEIAIHKKQKRISSKKDWLRVVSAFGGLAVYKKEVFSKSQYSSKSKEGANPTCEHVPFHESLDKRGFRLFINPRFINSVWNEHNEIHRLLPKLRRKLALTRELLFS